MRLQPTPFVLLAKTRSGSKWLIELLDGHPEVAAYGELLGGDQVPADYGTTGYPRYTSWLGTRRRLPGAVAHVSYLHGLFATHPEAKAVGVKLVYGYLGPTTSSTRCSRTRLRRDAGSMPPGSGTGCRR